MKQRKSTDKFASALQSRPNYSELPLKDCPAFEFITGGNYYAIFADGRVVGAPKEDGLLVLNRIPMMINAAAK